jgi:hypothetical protein
LIIVWQALSLDHLTGFFNGANIDVIEVIPINGPGKWWAYVSRPEETTYTFGPYDSAADAKSKVESAAASWVEKKIKESPKADQHNLQATPVKTNFHKAEEVRLRSLTEGQKMKDKKKDREKKFPKSY